MVSAPAGENAEELMIRYSAIIADGSFPCNTAILQGDMRTVFRQAGEAGYDCVQLTIRDRSDYSVEELRALSAEYGLQISAMATGRVYTVDGYSMASSDETNRRMCVERLRDLADFSVLLGRPALVVGAVRGRYADARSPEEYYRQFDKSLHELTDYCEKIDVPVILEVIERAESEAYCDPEETRRYVEGFRSPNLHMYLDVMHLHNEGMDVPAAIRKYGRFSRQIDISGENRTAPMDSALDFAKIAEAIRTSGFRGTLAFEMPPSPPEDSARKSLRFIKGLLEQDK